MRKKNWKNKFVKSRQNGTVSGRAWEMFQYMKKIQ